MRRHLGWIVCCISLLAGGVTLCAIRWKAWFSIPTEPEWRSKTLRTQYITFSSDTTFACQWTDTLSIAVLGDVHNSLLHSDYEQIAEVCSPLMAYAQVGDFVDREQFYYKQLLRYELKGTLFDSVPVMTCPGNHEYTKGLTRHLPQSWYESYTYPDNGPTRFIGSTYYVDFKNLRFIALDTEGLQRLSDYTRVNTWVKDVIRSAYQPWVVVMMHKPVYASRRGRSNPLIRLTFSHALDGADIVFSGHDHTYARRQHKDEPVWIGLSSTIHARRAKRHSLCDTIVEGGPFFGHLTVTNDNLSLYTYTLDEQCVDSVVLTK